MSAAFSCFKHWEAELRVLVACEESQVVCKAFREKGHEAYSCDLQDCSGGRPEWHIKGDVLDVIEEGWDLVIAHPPCTYLSNAGARWLYKNHELNAERYKKGLEGKAFFMRLLNCSAKHVAIENPVPSRVYELPLPTQIIQPYQFGEPWSKKTCLWLRNLPPLKPTEIVEDHRPYVSSGSYSRNHDPKYKGFSRKGGAAKVRSKTFPGIGKAMAEQWG